MRREPRALGAQDELLAGHHPFVAAGRLVQFSLADRVEGVAPVPDDRERVLDDLDARTVSHGPASVSLPVCPRCTITALRPFR